MPPRLFVAPPLSAGAEISLPEGAARHAQVLRLQPGAALTLFDGTGGEWEAHVSRMGRNHVQVRVGGHVAVERELSVQVTLAVGMPANERMDMLVEKATELGVASIQPLLSQRSVLRLAGDRALKKTAHWQAVAVAASEQSGRTRVPRVEAVRALDEWVAALPAVGSERRVVLSPGGGLPPSQVAVGEAGSVWCLSGPEGGLTTEEEEAGRRCGFERVWLGPRVLRADTAPLALLAHLAASNLEAVGDCSQDRTGPPRVFLTPAGSGSGAARPWGPLP